jgi:hypothetical protein
MKLISFGVFIALASLVLIPLATAPSQDSKRESDGAGHLLARFSVFRDGDTLLVPVRVQEKEYAFILDTGASYSGFDISLLSGDPIEVASGEVGSGTASLKFYKAPKAAIGTLPFPGSDKVVGLDFAKSRQVSGHPIRGVIGMDFLRRHVVKIDFDNGELELLKAASEQGANRVPIRFANHGVPYVTVQTLGGTFDFVIDTGFVGTNVGWVDSVLFNLAVSAGKLKVTRTILSLDASGVGNRRLAVGSELQLADFKINDSCVGEGNGHVLILSFWSRFVATFDFPNGFAYLVRGKAFDRPDAWDRSGLHVLRDDGKTLVHSADKESSGERVGIKAGDEIVSMSGKKASELRLFEIRRQFATPGETIPLVIRRDGKDYQASLKLAD